jgi:hypothetical protein
MKIGLLLGMFLLSAQIPKNDPNGIWEADTGSKYAMRLSGTDLRVEIVEGSNPRFLKYEVTLKNLEEANTYKGTGFFVARLQNGKECKFDTEWHIVIVAPNRILGATSNVIPDPNTCEVKERGQIQIDLRKK